MTRRTERRDGGRIFVCGPCHAGQPPLLGHEDPASVPDGASHTSHVVAEVKSRGERP